MIAFTGDIHGGVDIEKLSNRSLKKRGISLTENDFLMIAGDFGLPFLDEDIEAYENGESNEYTYWINWLSEKPYTVLWVDGNHENHAWWDKQPVTEKFGGRVQVHPHAGNVIRLMRGEIYEINGKRIFTFGGAVSTDQEYRTEGCSWWPREQAGDDEIAHAEEKLDSAGREVDYIVTHTMPMSRIIGEYYRPVPDRGAEYFDKVMNTVKYKVWVCGHFHVDRLLDNNICILYNEIVSGESLESIIERRSGR